MLVVEAVVLGWWRRCLTGSECRPFWGCWWWCDKFILRDSVSVVVLLQKLGGSTNVVVVQQPSGFVKSHTPNVGSKYIPSGHCIWVGTLSMQAQNWWQSSLQGKNPSGTGQVNGEGEGVVESFEAYMVVAQNRTRNINWKVLIVLLLNCVITEVKVQAWWIDNIAKKTLYFALI